VAAIVLSTINAKWIHPSLALRLLKANLPPNLQRGGKVHSGSDDCVILEFALRQPLAEKTAAILAEAPKILALSVSVWNHEATLELLRALEDAWSKAAKPSAISKNKPPVAAKPVIVLGGPEITGLIDAFRVNPQSVDESDPSGEFNPPDLSGSPRSCTDEPELFRHADFVISGEGEAVFADLCRTILDEPAVPMAAEIPAATMLYGKYIKANPVDPAAINGAYDLYTGEDLRQKLIYVESSRGCPYSCAFCQSAVNPVREFPLEEFLNRLDKLLQRGIENTAVENTAENKKPAKTTTIKFLDRSFNVNIPRALAILEFCLGYTSGSSGGINSGNKFQFHFEMVPAVFSPELRAMLARFPPGSLRLEIGIQSFNPQTCAVIHRNSNPENELKVLTFLREKTNAIIHADLIAGLPGEDIESFGRGFDRLWAAMNGRAIHNANADSGGNAAPFEIQLGILKCLPGTPIHAMAESGEFAVTYNKNPPYEVMETDCLSAADMEKIKNFARFWELIVNRNAFPLPMETPVFAGFMELSQKLRERFGRNYGIPREELKTFLLHPC